MYTDGYRENQLHNIQCRNYANAETVFAPKRENFVMQKQARAFSQCKQTAHNRIMELVCVAPHYVLQVLQMNMTPRLPQKYTHLHGLSF